MPRSVRLPPLFGLNIDPAANAVALAFDVASYADRAGLDLIGVQDHPYNPAFLDTWTLLAAIGARTQRVRLMPNVANLPLRPPAMLAKAVATLDILTDGRVELGLGAGALWDAVAGYGGPRRTPGEATAALEEAIQVLHLLWDRPGRAQPVAFSGTYYQLEHARPGPPPAHPIGIWLGALKPRMLRLTGRLADGWSVSYNWTPPAQIPALQAEIDAAAAEAGRDANEIRRNYNLMGVIQQAGQPQLRVRQPGMLIGSADEWIVALADFYRELEFDSFMFWPIAGDALEQARLWAEQVVPAVREQVSIMS